MPNVGITSGQAAADFGALRALVQSVYAEQSYRPLVIGPDVGGCAHANGFQPIMDNHPPVDVQTFHHYVLPGGERNGRAAYTVQNFTDAALSNTTRDLIATYAAIKAADAPRTPMWIGEGATTYSQPLDGSYAMLYNYLNILKEGGKQGIAAFIKQALGGLFYAQRGNATIATYQPSALYAFAVLWKMTMGVEVHDVEVNGSDKVIAVNRGLGVALANLDDEDVTVFARCLNGCGGSVHGSSARSKRNSAGVGGGGNRCQLFLLEPTVAEGVVGKDGLINGAPLVADLDGSFPAINPTFVDCAGGIAVPPMALAFIVLPDE